MHKREKVYYACSDTKSRVNLWGFLAHSLSRFAQNLKPPVANHLTTSLIIERFWYCMTIKGQPLWLSQFNEREFAILVQSDAMSPILWQTNATGIE